MLGYLWGKNQLYYILLCVSYIVVKACFRICNRQVKTEVGGLSVDNAITKFFSTKSSSSVAPPNAEYQIGNMGVRNTRPDRRLHPRLQCTAHNKQRVSFSGSSHERALS